MVDDLLKFSLSIFFRYFIPLHKHRVKDRNLVAATGLYKGEEFAELFCKIRSWDSPYNEVEKIVPKRGDIVDLGSGDGLVGNYLAIASKKRKVFGIELNKKRLKLSDRGVKNTRFVSSDILKYRLPKCDCVLLLHVLHHLPSLQGQEYLLEKVSKILKRNSKLIVLEIAETPVSKYVFTRLVDTFIVPILFENKLYDFNFHYRKSEEWVNLLRTYGFSVKKRLIDKGMPFPHVLLDATKK